MLPTVIVHADWGSDPKKRWAARAMLRSDGRYVAVAPEPVGAVADLIPGIRQEIGGPGSALIGFDFPIGVPMFYATAVHIGSFRSLWPQLGQGKWSDFFKVANKPSDISLYRPFYPLNTGGKRQADLVAGLGARCIGDLRRLCELAQPNRNAACPLFWTLGANQVGKAAIIGWRDVLAPALKESDSVVIWPFDGPLQGLMRAGTMVIAETYPAEYYRWFFAKQFKGKRKRENRQRVGPELLRWAEKAGVGMDSNLAALVEAGFPDGDDSFDAVIGLFGMLEVALGRREPGESEDQSIRNIEGWILGQTP